MLWFFKKLDWWMMGAVFFLLSISLLMMISLGSIGGYTPLFWFWRQLLWVLLGLVIFFLAAITDYRIFRINFAPVLIFYGLSLVLLAAVLILSHSVRGSRGWFSFGIISFQPVELAKIALVLLLAKYYSGKNFEIWRMRNLIIPAVYAFIPIALTALEPDMGSALILLAIWLILTLLSGIRLKHLILAGLILLMVAGLSWQVLLTHNQKDRVRAFINPGNNPASAYSSEQALIALGSGGVFGKGVGRGTQTQLNFLVEPRTDFIFAAIGEELGFAGILAVLGCFAIILWRIFATAVNYAGNNFAKLLSFGIFGIIFLNVVIQSGVNLHLLPVTGIPLPFLSYGGSSLILNMLEIGILASIRTRSEENTLPRREIASLSQSWLMS